MCSYTSLDSPGSISGKKKKKKNRLPMQQTWGDSGSLLGSGRSPGGGHGSPLQHSCLENPMDRGAWQATVHRTAQNRTRLKRLSTHTHTHTHTHMHTHIWTRAPLGIFHCACIFFLLSLSLPFCHYTSWVWCVTGFCFNKTFLTLIHKF